QRPRGERGEALDPLAPERAIGPLRERVDDGQREVAEMGEIRQIALVPRDPRRLRFVLPQLVDADPVVGREPVEAAPPPRAAVRRRARTRRSAPPTSTAIAACRR